MPSLLGRRFHFLLDFVQGEAGRRAHRITRILEGRLQSLPRLEGTQLAKRASGGNPDLFRKALP